MTKKRKKSSAVKWTLLWSDREYSMKIVGKHFEFKNCLPKLFNSRREARHYSQEKYGYIKERKDLRSYPHFWRMPNVVKVCVTVDEL